MKYAILTLALVFSSFATNASNLPKNGSFKYRYLGLIPIFNADLHIPKDYAAARFDPQKPLDLVFRYHQSISKEQLIQRADIALSSGKQASKIEQFSSQLDKLNGAYQDVERGDSYRLNYSPERGLTLYLNEEKLVTIEGDNFPEFYLSIWLGNSAKPSQMRNNLWADIPASGGQSK